MTQEALSSLKALGNQLRLQLLESAEFRALTVVDRTIAELSEILNASAPPPPGQESPLIRVDAPQGAAPIPVVQQAQQAAAPGPTSSQSRMAKAIADTIAAKAASIGAPAAAALRVNQALSAAS